MSDWKRQTKEVSMGDLAAETAAAFQNHIEKYNLGAILLDALMCVQTDSEKIKKGLLICFSGKIQILKFVIRLLNRKATKFLKLSSFPCFYRLSKF